PNGGSGKPTSRRHHELLAAWRTDSPAEAGHYVRIKSDVRIKSYARINSEGGTMRRLGLISLAGIVTAVDLIVFQSSSATRLQAQSAFAGGAAVTSSANNNLRGGPTGLVKTVLRGTVEPVDGLMVQL